MELKVTNMFSAKKKAFILFFLTFYFFSQGYSRKDYSRKKCERQL